MELNENPQQGHEHATTSLKVVLLIFAIVLIGALAYLISVTYNQPDTTDYTAPSVVNKTSETDASDDTDATDQSSGSEDKYSTLKSSFNFSFEYPKEWLFSADGRFDGLPSIVYTGLEKKEGESGVYNEQLLTVKAITYPESHNTFEKYLEDQASTTRHNITDTTIGSGKYAAKRFDDGGGLFGTTISYLVMNDGELGELKGITFVTLSITLDEPEKLPEGFQHMLDTLTLN